MYPYTAGVQLLCSSHISISHRAVYLTSVVLKACQVHHRRPAHGVVSVAMHLIYPRHTLVCARAHEQSTMLLKERQGPVVAKNGLPTYWVACTTRSSQQNKSWSLCQNQGTGRMSTTSLCLATRAEDDVTTTGAQPTISRCGPLRPTQ